MRTFDKELLGEWHRGMGTMLKCPKCDNDYLHHTNVMVFNCGEDAEKAHLTSVLEDGAEAIVTVAKVNNNTSLNPSPRRHGLLIDFWCETCGGAGPDKEPETITLAIFQHKGCTYMNWRQN
jgi:hypothetical protein